MKQFFFSDRNVSRQCRELEKLLNISNNGGIKAFPFKGDVRDKNSIKNVF